jgi:hypothetical protein
MPLHFPSILNFNSTTNKRNGVIIDNNDIDGTTSMEKMRHLNMQMLKQGGKQPIQILLQNWGDKKQLNHHYFNISYGTIIDHFNNIIPYKMEDVRQRKFM